MKVHTNSFEQEIGQFKVLSLYLLILVWCCCKRTRWSYYVWLL